MVQQKPQISKVQVPNNEEIKSLIEGIERAFPKAMVIHHIIEIETSAPEISAFFRLVSRKYTVPKPKGRRKKTDVEMSLQDLPILLDGISFTEEIG